MDDKWQEVTAAPIGTKANPLKDCAEAKVEFYVKGEVEFGQYFIVRCSFAVTLTRRQSRVSSVL
jgi:hypothetical protein